MEYCLPIKDNAVLRHGTTWMYLEKLILSQLQKNTYNDSISMKHPEWANLQTVRRSVVASGSEKWGEGMWIGS